VIDKLARDALAQNPDLPGLWIGVWDTADDLIEAAMTLPLSAPATGGYSTTNTIILGKMLVKLTGQPIGEIATDVARRAGLTQSASRRRRSPRCPSPPPTATWPPPAPRSWGPSA
jgi:CubicO group peptidase (beta-lactamase class C family)